MPRVCVVLPTYNRRRWLARAVDSVLSQTYADWELRIVDDGSTDGTEQWLNQIAQRFERVILVRQENQGVSRARNAAIFATSAEWVACLDSDDEWLPDKLDKQIQFADAHPDLPLIHGEEIWIRNGALVQPLKKHQKGGGRIFQRCLPLCCISPSTAMIRTEVLKSLGGFRKEFTVCEDYDLWLRICAQYEVGFIQDPLIVKNGGHADQLSRKYKAMDEFRVRALWDIRMHPSLSDDDRRAVYEELLKKCAILMNGYTKYGRSDAAARLAPVQSEALNQLHQLKRANSAADLAPRSDAIIV